MLKSRRAVLMLGLSSAVLGSLACGAPPREAAADRLLLQTSRGVIIVEPGASQPAFRAPFALPSQDWSTIVRSAFTGHSTTLRAVDPESGRQKWGRILGRNLNLKVVSGDGRTAALSPARERYYLYGRPSTTLLITGEDFPTPQKIELDGNYEPEAFSTDGQSLFVLQYRPARLPTRYQVRRLDLRSEKVMGVYTPDADLQESMRGTARVQATSPEGTRLYTLYTVGRGDDRRAFIHVLNLEELWAHCIDLPTGFADEAESATALTSSPDGRRLYVANAAAEAVAEIDTQRLTTVRTGELNFAPGSQTHALHGERDTLFFARGDRVTMVDAVTLTQKRLWLVDEKVRGLQLGRAGQLYVALKESIVMIDLKTGDRLRTFDPPGIKRIAQFGRTPRALDDDLSKISCAC
ncbi:MAG: YncE family protein [Actinomycetota bacterium]